MIIEKITIDNEDYRLFADVRLFPNTKKEVWLDYVAEEKLNKRILKALEDGEYSSYIQRIDELFGYSVSQDIADTEDEEQIRKEIEEFYEI